MKKATLITILISLIMLIPSFAYAQELTVDFPYIVGFSSISEFFDTIVNWGIYLTVLVAGLYILYGGIRYTAAGSDTKSAESARRIIANAIIGVIIASSTFLILKVLTLIIPGLNEILTV